MTGRFGSWGYLETQKRDKSGRIRPDLAERNRQHSGKKHYRWSGNNASDRAARKRAKKVVKCAVGYEHHHFDGNPRNNTPENLMVIKRKEHMKLDGRLDRLIEGNKSGRWRRGKKHSSETKKKLSEIAKKRSYSRNSKGQFCTYTVEGET